MFKFVRSKSVWLILPFYCCFRFLFSEISLRTFCSVWNFQGCITVYLSRYFVVALRGNFDIISCCFLFVKNFFNKFFSNFFNIYSFQQLFEFIITLLLCQELFLLSFLKKERRRRDLNPRAAINDLHPFQGCPFGQLGYFSELHYILIRTDFHQ